MERWKHPHEAGESPSQQIRDYSFRKQKAAFQMPARRNKEHAGTLVRPIAVQPTLGVSILSYRKICSTGSPIIPSPTSSFTSTSPHLTNPPGLRYDVDDDMSMIPSPYRSQRNFSPNREGRDDNSDRHSSSPKNTGNRHVSNPPREIGIPQRPARLSPSAYLLRRAPSNGSMASVSTRGSTTSRLGNLPSTKRNFSSRSLCSTASSTMFELDYHMEHANRKPQSHHSSKERTLNIQSGMVNPMSRYLGGNDNVFSHRQLGSHRNH